MDAAARGHKTGFPAQKSAVFLPPDASKRLARVFWRSYLTIISGQNRYFAAQALRKLMAGREPQIVRAALGVLHVTIDLRPDPGAGTGARPRRGLRGRVDRLHGRGRRCGDAGPRRPPVARIAHETAESLPALACVEINQ